MKHKTEGLARPCSAQDLFLSSQGLQCGNCLAVEERVTGGETSQYHRDRVYQWHHASNKICTCKICWPIDREKVR